MEIPPALTSLGDYLEGRGYRRSATEIAESFGEVSFTYDGPLLRIQMSLDRGGKWFMEIGRREWDAWYDADIWRACVEGGDAPVEPRDLATQTEYVAQHLDELAEAATKQPDLFDCLRRVGTERAMKRISRPL